MGSWWTLSVEKGTRINEGFFKPPSQSSDFETKLVLLLWRGPSRLLLLGQVIGIEKKLKEADKVPWPPSRSSEWVSQDIKAVRRVELTLQEKTGTDELLQAKLAELMWQSSWLITPGKGENEGKNGVKTLPMKPVMLCFFLREFSSSLN